MAPDQLIRAARLDIYLSVKFQPQRFSEVPKRAGPSSGCITKKRQKLKFRDQHLEARNETRQYFQWIRPHRNGIPTIEKTFEEEGILEELEAYNPLIPDGSNFKCTMMIEYPDESIRKEKLRLLKGIEDKVWVKVEGRDKVWAIADEDLQRENDEKTSAVHFLRFELDEDMVKSLKYGVGLAIGVEHEAYTVSVDPLQVDVRNSLAGDLI